jgi:hypothetical protein
LGSVALALADGPDNRDLDTTRIARGFQISPVSPEHFDLRGKNPALVGLGSYLVNAVGGCNDCHTCPSYEPGQNPFVGGSGKVNSTNYLAGGVPFGPFKSANLTPDLDKGLPEGHTFKEFADLIRTGHDPDEGNRILQVMPWPVYRNMTDLDLRAIYEYISVLPHAEPGACTMAGQ